MADKALAKQTSKPVKENLPIVGTGRRMTLNARRDLDRREREVFTWRRDGFTFQEIEDLLRERAEKTKKETGKSVPYFTSIGNIKQAYDRYIMRCPERFDIAGRKEQLELAIQRAEDNYKRLNAASREKGLDANEKARLTEQAGKWFDRLSKLRALTEDSVTINNFVQNNISVTDQQLLEKMNAVVVDITPNQVPEYAKSIDTVPPMPQIVDAVLVEDEEVDLSEFAESAEQPTEINIAQPNKEVAHEEIKPASPLMDIQFVL